jgi:hypothetical protein
MWPRGCTVGALQRACSQVGHASANLVTLMPGICHSESRPKLELEFEKRALESVTEGNVVDSVREVGQELLSLGRVSAQSRVHRLLTRFWMNDRVVVDAVSSKSRSTPQTRDGHRAIGHDAYGPNGKCRGRKDGGEAVNRTDVRLLGRFERAFGQAPPRNEPHAAIRPAGMTGVNCMDRRPVLNRLVSVPACRPE